jgi:hypothetical protein
MVVKPLICVVILTNGSEKANPPWGWLFMEQEFMNKLLG